MRRENLPILLLLLLAFGLRVWGSADHNIWWDEGVGVWLARLPASTILHWTAHDVHPPLYYLLLRGWWLLVGEGEFVLRFPSAAAGTLGVALAYGLGRALGGRRAGVLTALFLTLSRFHITWSQEVRMYTCATTLSTGALWAAVRMWRRGGWRAWIAYVLTTAGSLWTLYLTGPVPLIANLAFPLGWLQEGRPRRRLIHWATAQVAASALFIPWAAYALPRMHTWSTDQPVPSPFFAHLYSTTLAVGVPVNLEAYTPLTLAVFGVLIVGLAALWRARRSPAQTAGLAMLLLGLLLPALLVYAVSIPANPYFARPLVPRYFLPLSACFYALLGWGLATLAQKRRWAAGLGVGLAVGVALNGLASFYPGRARRDDYTSLTAALQAHRHPHDVVVLHTDKDWPIFAAHYPGDWHGVPYGAPMDPAAADSLLTPLWGEAEGIWLVTTPDAQRADPEQAVRRWLETRAVISATWGFGENGLSFFARTPGRAESFHDLAPGFTPPDGPRAELAPGVTLLGAWVGLPRYPTGDTARVFLYWESPPQAALTMEMAGPARQATTAAPPTPARSGPTRQQVNLPLTPDLPGGRYQLRVQVGEGPTVDVGHLTLVRRTVGKTASPAEIPHPLDLRLGESIRLLGYDLPQTVVEPGGTVELTLYWQATEAVETRYKVFTHLLGETYNAATDNFLWGQQDNEPVNGQVPTTVWAPGTVVADPYHIPVAPDAPPGRYTLEIGLYGLVDGVRLPVFDTHGTPLGDAVILAHVEVRPPQ
ncbi:MAG TPA: hypothetical protein EYH30_02010 [Anaerolineales bacterium]|nr:hypothetical protein [Anaerolineales bacterium]